MCNPVLLAGFRRKSQNFAVCSKLGFHLSTTARIPKGVRHYDFRRRAFRMESHSACDLHLNKRGPLPATRLDSPRIFCVSFYLPLFGNALPVLTFALVGVVVPQGGRCGEQPVSIHFRTGATRASTVPRYRGSMF